MKPGRFPRGGIACLHIAEPDKTGCSPCISDRPAPGGGSAAPLSRGFSVTRRYSSFYSLLCIRARQRPTTTQVSEAEDVLNPHARMQLWGQGTHTNPKPFRPEPIRTRTVDPRFLPGRPDWAAVRRRPPHANGAARPTGQLG